MQAEFKPGELAPLKTLKNRYGVVTKTIDRWIKEQGFPRPVMLNARKRVWPVAAVLEWEKSRAISSQEAAE